MVMTWTTPELAPPLLTTTPHQREDVSALDRFNVHRCPTRRIFSGTGLEPVTKQATKLLRRRKLTNKSILRWYHQFKKTGCLCKKNAAAGQASWKKQWRGRGRILFEVHGSLRELPPMNLECPNKQFGKLYEGNLISSRITSS
ncbi:uncharacterized protein TNCV_1314801 [Trichonephila clavipes]|uniref:Uncharacterized protein n=1 Tax=Trichonephila clavipes TaxID=2585209 RepID=A0A8X6SJA4_TRICX|nr:uncharacterized protein TNCV_1314801 [Trichonephila clavipes]